MKKTKRILALVLGMMMILSLLPTNLVFAASNVSYVDADGTAKTQSSATDVISSDTSWGTSGSATWYYASGTIEISSRVTVNGDVHLILADGCVLTANGGIRVKNGNSFTIYAQSTDADEMGTLTANGKTDSGNAGIGGNNGEESGTITINGGKITANGASGAYGTNGGAGIGGGSDAAGKNITINGGIITAIGCTSLSYGANDDWAGAGIGGGGSGDNRGGAAQNITITGGTVTAIGGKGDLGTGAGIGGGSGKGGTGTSSNILIIPTAGLQISAYNAENSSDDSKAMSGSPFKTQTDISSLKSGRSFYSETSVATYSITFDANGGTGEMNAVTGTYGYKYQLPTECTFTAPEGTKFNGWAESTDGDVLTWEQHEITGDKTFYAVWEPNTHISFDLLTVYSTGATGYRLNEKITRYWKNGDSSNFTGSENDYNMKIEWSKRNGKDVATISFKGVDIQTSSNCLLVLGHSELEIDIIVEDASTLGSISVYDSDVNISGGGKLTINDPNVDSQNIYVSGNLMVDGTEIYADSLSEKAVNVIFASGDMEINNGSKIDISSASDITNSNYAALRANGKMTISGNSKVSVTCTEAATCYAVMSGNDFVIEDSTVNIENAGTNRAISAGGNISVTQTTGTTKVSASAKGIAMAATNGKVTVNGGTVELISSANNALRVLNGIEVKGASDVTIKGGTGKKAIRFDGTDGLTVGEGLTTVASIDRNGANLMLYAIENKDYYQYIQVADIPSYSVTLEANGGTINSGDIESYTKGVSVELPTDVTMEGYKFLGWYENEDLSGDKVTEVKNDKTGDVTYYAKWAANISEMEKNGAYKVVHYKETADGSYTEVTEDTQFPLYAKIGTTVTAEAKTYEGYTLNNGKTVASTPLAEPKVEDGELVITTLAFYYDLNEYTITFDTDGGSEVEAITQKYTTAVTSPETPIKEGYVFDSWDKEIPVTMPAENVTITALWKKIISTEISLTAPVANAAPQTTIDTDEYTATVVWSPEVTDKFAYSTAYTATITITPKANYTVKGIAENGYTVDGSETVTNTADSATVTVTYAETGRRPSSSGGGVSRYTVKFETNGGSTVASKTVTRNSTISEPTAPTKDGYTFMGWYTDKELTKAYDFDTKVTKAITLYAKWEKHDDENIDDKTDNKTDTPDAPVWENPFTDVKLDDWYYKNVEYAVENGLFNGTTKTTFAPNGIITRAMMVTVLYRAEGEPTVTGTATFEDVDLGAYYAKAVVWGQQNGIIKGYSETVFAPDQNITREQIAAIMHRYAQYKEYDVSVGENTNILSYSDYDSISEYAIASMQYAVGSGLMKGKTASTLNPLDNATRAEIAAILHRFLEANK